MTLRRHGKTANQLGRTEECGQSIYSHLNLDGEGRSKPYGNPRRIKLEAHMLEVMEPSLPRGRCTYLEASPVFPFGVYWANQSLKQITTTSLSVHHLTTRYVECKDGFVGE